MALGLVQGPTEVLPVSSSGHLALVPQLLGWSYTSLDPELRKSFEVALHAGAAAALALSLRSEVRQAVAELDAARFLRHALELLPPAAAALAFERPIEERLGSTRGVALAQLGAGALLLAADRLPQRRASERATPLDGLAIGLAQACALVPGVSRNGASITAARMLGFERGAASRLSRHAALGVIAGATLLKGVRLARRGLEPSLRPAFAAGAAAAFASTLLSAPLVRRLDAGRSLAPLALYRMALGAAAAASA